MNINSQAFGKPSNNKNQHKNIELLSTPDTVLHTLHTFLNQSNCHNSKWQLPCELPLQELKANPETKLNKEQRKLKKRTSQSHDYHILKRNAEEAFQL